MHSVFQVRTYHSGSRGKNEYLAILTQMKNIREDCSIAAELPYMTILKVPSSTQEYKSGGGQGGDGHKESLFHMSRI